MPVCFLRMPAIVFQENRFAPEIQAVDIAVGEIEWPLVRFKRRRFRIALRRIITDRKRPADDDAAGRLQRPQIGLRDLGAEIVSRERPGADQNIYMIAAPFQFNRRRRENQRKYASDAGKTKKPCNQTQRSTPRTSVSVRIAGRADCQQR